MKEAEKEPWVEWLSVPLEHAAAAGDADLVNDLLAAGVDRTAGWKVSPLGTVCLARYVLFCSCLGRESRGGGCLAQERF